jgi:fermentation-respiration switch protein FrsA (DUF1100 family)
MQENLVTLFLRHPFFRILRVLAVLYVLLLVVVYLFQRKLQYFPDSSIVPNPAGNGYLGLETIELYTPDGVRLVSWHWPGSLPTTLVIFHGNAGHRGHRLEWISDLHRLGYGIFILDYRGYGGSEGAPSEQGLYVDAETAARWLKEKTKTQLVYFGESLGCGVAVETACRIPPASMILQSGFASAGDIAQNAYPFLPARWLLKDRYDSSRKMQNIHCPLLVIHGDQDSVIPIRFGKALFDLANEPKEWSPIVGADHNDLQWVGGKKYLKTIDAFLQRHPRLKG